MNDSERIEELEAYVRMLEMNFEDRVDREVERRLPDAIREHEQQQSKLDAKKFMDMIHQNELIAKITETTDPSLVKPFEMNIKKERNRNASTMATTYGLEIKRPTYMGVDLGNGV